jgi:hypothetical protein
MPSNASPKGPTTPSDPAARLSWPPSVIVVLLTMRRPAPNLTGWREALAALFAANYQRWLAGQPLAHVVDKRAGYPAPQAG